MTDNFFSDIRILLASKSPRRKQMMEEMGIPFTIVAIDHEESFPAGLSGEEVALHIAQAKAGAYRDRLADNEILITADTIVWCNGMVLGKPADREEAVNMIAELSGNTHDVITGVCICTRDREQLFAESTRVTFNILSSSDISFYVDNYKPYDKAGAYGIQEWIGMTGCQRIEGSYFNVMGLPTHRLYSELRLFINPEQ